MCDSPPLSSKAAGCTNTCQELWQQYGYPLAFCIKWETASWQLKCWYCSCVRLLCWAHTNTELYSSATTLANMVTTLAPLLVMKAVLQLSDCRRLTGNYNDGKLAMRLHQVCCVAEVAATLVHFGKWWLAMVAVATIECGRSTTTYIWCNVIACCTEKNNTHAKYIQLAI